MAKKETQNEQIRELGETPAVKEIKDRVFSKQEVIDNNKALQMLIILSDKISSELRTKVMKTKINFSTIADSIEKARELTINNCKVEDKINEEKFWSIWNSIVKEEVSVKIEEITANEFETLLSANKDNKLTVSHVEILMKLFKQV